MVAQTSHRNSTSELSGFRPSIESLESRRLMNGALIGSFAGAIPAALPPGGVEHATVRLTNPPGQTQTGQVTVSLYLSQSTSLGDDGILLGTATRRVRLPGGRSATFPFRFASPSAASTGNEYLLARIDGPANSDGSLNETLVASPQTVSVFQPVVDLSGQIAALPMTLFVNNSYSAYGQARIQVFNNGNAPARGPLQITMYLSTDGSIDSTAVMAGVTNFPAVNIRPGGGRAVAVRLAVPAGTPVGSYTVLASINSSNTIVESNTTNNIAVGQHPLTLANAPVVIDLRHHRHNWDNTGSDESGIDVEVDTGTEYVDNSADTSTDESAPTTDTGSNDATPQPTTQPDTGSNDSGTDNSGSDGSGGSDWGGDNSGGDSAGSDDSGSGDSGGSDFGDASPVDSSAGSDFSLRVVHRNTPVRSVTAVNVRR